MVISLFPDLYFPQKKVCIGVGRQWGITEEACIGINMAHSNNGPPSVQLILTECFQK